MTGHRFSDRYALFTCRPDRDLGIPLAFVLGGATIICLIITATFGMLVIREGSKIPFTWHVNMARLTIALALIHALVVYWTFF